MLRRGETPLLLLGGGCGRLVRGIDVQPLLGRRRCDRRIDRLARHPPVLLLFRLVPRLGVLELLLERAHECLVRVGHLGDARLPMAGVGLRLRGALLVVLHLCRERRTRLARVRRRRLQLPLALCGRRTQRVVVLQLRIGRRLPMLRLCIFELVLTHGDPVVKLRLSLLGWERWRWRIGIQSGV